MKVTQGDIWRDAPEGSRIVVTTNIGWDRSTLQNNMGAGTALEAMRRAPWLPRMYGTACSMLRDEMPVMTYQTLQRLVPSAAVGRSRSARQLAERLVFFPVKPLLTLDEPERSWNQRASLSLIRRSCIELSQIHGTVALTIVGAGNGRADPNKVLRIMERYLKSDRFLVIDLRHLS